MIEYFMCLATGYILAYAVYRRKTIPKKALLCIDGREIKLLKVKEYESVLQYGNRYWQKAKDSDYLLTMGNRPVAKLWFSLNPHGATCVLKSDETVKPQYSSELLNMMAETNLLRALTRAIPYKPKKSEAILWLVAGAFLGWVLHCIFVAVAGGVM